jgi:hypothetical protein
MVNLKGSTFGCLIVVRRLYPWEYASSTSRQVRWLCRCECGHERAVISQNLRKGVHVCKHHWAVALQNPDVELLAPYEAAISDGGQCCVT